MSQVHGQADGATGAVPTGPRSVPPMSVSGSTILSV